MPATSGAGMERELEHMLAGLDSAIERAVQNPLTFAGGPLDSLEAACHEVTRLQQVNGAAASPACEELLWQVRARAGRLQMLLDAANRFYSHCFSSCEAPDWDYGADGAWSESAHASHLHMSC